MPLAILWFGLTDRASGYIVFIGPVFPIFLTTATAVRATGRHYVNAALCLGASQWALLTQIIRPGALPETFTSLRVGIPIKITGYQFHFELRLEATPGVASIAGLARKKIGTPFGTTAYELASKIVAANQLGPSTLVNVGATDLGTALHDGQIAAASIWDPIWGILEKTYGTRPLAHDFHSGITAMRAAFVASERPAAVKFLAAQILAVAFRANNPAEVDRPYQAAFGVPPAIAQVAQAIDRS